ncbi:MAG: transcription elongation factor [Opitutus sp.]|nr:transcription elongation factor [Opitutus sp.]
MKKTELRDAILQQLHLELARQTSAVELAHDEAISEESRAESKWDTHSQEAAYLAEGQAKLADEIAGSIELYGALRLPDFGTGDVIALGALVQVEPAVPSRSKTARASYFLGPRAGGLELNDGGRQVLVLTPQSPLGRQLLGKRVGDVVQSPGRGTASVQQRIASVE